MNFSNAFLPVVVSISPSLLVKHLVCCDCDWLSSKEQEESEWRAIAFPFVEGKKSALLLNDLLGAAIKAWAEQVQALLLRLD